MLRISFLCAELTVARPLTDQLAETLQGLRSARLPAPTQDDPVFVNRYGKPGKSWRTAFSNALERAGISEFRFHDLRHCFGSWLAMSGTTGKGAMELMGHKDPKMTLRYTHLSMDYKRPAVAKLPQFGTGIMESESPQISPSEPAAKVVGFAK